MEDVWRAIGLVLIIEGLLPTLMPEAWRDAMAKMSLTNPANLRMLGLVSLMAGAALFHFLG